MRTQLLVLAATASLAFAGCGNDDGGSANNNSNNNNCNLEATFTSIHDNLLSQPSCASAGCHNAGSAFGGLNFEAGKDEVYRQLTEDAVVNTGASATKRIDTTPETSFLFVRLTNMGATGPMPPTGVIESCNTDKVSEWITAGAAND